VQKCFTIYSECNGFHAKIFDEHSKSSSKKPFSKKTYFCTLIFFIAVKVTQNTIGLESIRHIVTTLERNFGKIWLSSVPSIAMESFINVVEVQ
jgi:hypothetical protein